MSSPCMEGGGPQVWQEAGSMTLGSQGLHGRPLGRCAGPGNRETGAVFPTSSVTSLLCCVAICLMRGLGQISCTPKASLSQWTCLIQQAEFFFKPTFQNLDFFVHILYERFYMIIYIWDLLTD